MHVENAREIPEYEIDPRELDFSNSVNITKVTTFSLWLDSYAYLIIAHFTLLLFVLCYCIRCLLIFQNGMLAFGNKYTGMFFKFIAKLYFTFSYLSWSTCHKYTSYCCLGFII